MRHGSLARQVDDGGHTATGFPLVNGDIGAGDGARVATPLQASLWVGLDVGEGARYADVLDDDRERLFSRVSRTTDIEAPLESEPDLPYGYPPSGFIPGRMSDHGRPGEEAPAVPFVYSRS